MADQEPETKTFWQKLGCLNFHERVLRWCNVIVGYGKAIAFLVIGGILLSITLFIGSYAWGAYKAVGNAKDAVISAPGKAWSATKGTSCKWTGVGCTEEQAAIREAEKAAKAAEKARIQAEEEAAEAATAQAEAEAEAEEARQRAEAEANGETEPGLFSRGWDRATDWIPGVGGDDAPAEENTE
ncbi:MAG: hypothetical protein VYE61_00970 [Pseudomonadota bacterium]|nr:hypothetical protein [Pseudomonadota bacterium]MEC9290854.1 hypothetical protein [Pseudomonadota bacterium]